jgi:hypothetical protein
MTARPALRTFVAVGVVILLAAITGLVFVNRKQTLPSLEKLDDHPLYVMRYTGDYGFQEYLKTGARPQASAPSAQNPDWACTCFSALNPAGDPLYGRNFDWDNDPILVLLTDSPDGYASITTVDVKYLGITRDALTDQDRQRLLGAPYLPFDGMNEYGLVVGMMAVDAEPPRDPGKVTIGSLEAIRLMLDYAKTVDEAVSLIGQYNIDFTSGPGLHYLVSDRGGHSALIEFTGGKMIVLRSETPWQVSTNFIITGKSADEARSSCTRYAAASRRLEETRGRLTMDEALGLLRDVSQPSTLWSVVYNMHSGETKFTVRRDYEQKYTFQMKMK